MKFGCNKTEEENKWPGEKEAAHQMRCDAAGA